MEEEHESLSLSARRKKSPISISCFHHRRSDSSSPSASPSLRKSPTTWFKSKLMCHDHMLRESQCISNKHRRSRSSVAGCIGRHRRHSSPEFSYDPLSYALNFQEEDESAEERKFIERLPVSPPRVKKAEDLAAANSVRNPSTRREKAAGELRENVFEVRVPRRKTEVPRSPVARSPPAGTRLQIC